MPTLATIPDAELLELLREEYFRHQDIIDKFDDRRLQLKGWSVTVALAGLVAAFATKELDDTQRGIVCLIVAVGAASFWQVEMAWKSFQQCFYARVTEIETWFRDPSRPIDPVQLNTSWLRQFRARSLRTTVRHGLKWSTLLPHLPVAVIALLLAVYCLA